MSFDRLQERIDELRNPTVIGLDTALEYIPPQILEKHMEAAGETLEAAASAVYEFNTGLIDALYDIVPAIKPQLAYYEALGFDGVRALRMTCDYAKSKGMYVIFDGKRNDIGSTAEAYSAAYLGTVKVGGTELRPFDADALTVNAYTGSDGIKPFIGMAVKHDKAIFVLVKTSNPSAGELQDMFISEHAATANPSVGEFRDRFIGEQAATANPSAGELRDMFISEQAAIANPSAGELRDMFIGEQAVTAPAGPDRRLYTAVGDLIEGISRGTTGKYGFTRVGAVVGATYPEEIGFLRSRLKHTFFLVPGYGAQGGAACDAARAFDGKGHGAIINSSRAVIAAWKKNGGSYAAAARAEALRMRDELREHIGRYSGI